MNVVYKDQLSKSEVDAMKLLYNSVTDPSVYQHVLFPYFLKKGSTNNYAMLYSKEKKMLGYCIIIESYLRKLPFIKTSRIIQGPIAEAKETEVELLNSICSYYKNKKYVSVFIQLRHLVGNHSESILSEFYKSHHFDRDAVSQNQCTLLIDLRAPINNIYENFTSVLKKNIKSAINKQVQVSEIFTQNEIREFAAVYSKMCIHRNITLYSYEEIIGLCNFALKENNGFLLKSSIKGKMMGGGIFINQGKKTVYMIGATDPEFKKIPLSHLVLYEAIKISQQKEQETFDMGGVSYSAQKGEQADAINQFKLNFSSNYVFYAKKINVIFRPFLNKIIAMALKVKNH